MVLARASPILQAAEAVGELVIVCTGITVLCLSLVTLDTGAYDYNSFTLSLNPKEVQFAFPLDDNERLEV